MIENIRKYQGLIFVVIVVLLIGFVMMGSSDVLRSSSGGGGDFIQIDGRNYSQGDFNKIGKNPLNLAQSLRSFDENGIQIMQFASTLMSGAQTEETAAQNFFASRIILKEAFAEFGVHPSQEEIEKFIKGLSTFQVRPAPGSPMGATTGEFDQAAYNQFIDGYIGRLGLKESDPEVIPERFLSPGNCVYDTIYQPPETAFLASARRAGCRTGNGMSLLIHQGAIAFQHWFPGSDPLPYMREAMGSKR